MRGARALAAVGALLLGAGCAALQHQLTRDDFAGQLLRADRGRGLERLELERAFDATVRDWVDREGVPDYLLVESDARALRLYYVDESQVVRFARAGWERHSTATVSDDLPESVRARHARRNAQAQDAAPAALPPVAAAPPAPGIVMAARRINVRGGPGLDQPILRKAQPGEELAYADRDGDWFRLRSPGEPAFVHARVVLPYHRVNVDVRPGYRAQIRALVPKGTSPGALPGLAERLAQRQEADFFLVAFFDRVEAVNLFRGTSAPTSAAERSAWRCNVTVNFGRAVGGCVGAGGRDLTLPLP